MSDNKCFNIFLMVSCVDSTIPKKGTTFLFINKSKRCPKSDLFWDTL